MKPIERTLTLAAIFASTSALAHPGDGAHVHWEFPVAGLVFAVAVAFLVRRLVRGAARRD